jgi:hypothetical protein
MSDYALYQEMRLRSPRAAKLWRMGEIGLYGAMAAGLTLLPLVLIWVGTAPRPGEVIIYLLGCLALIIGSMLFGLECKNRARRMAERDGVLVDAFG